MGRGRALPLCSQAACCQELGPTGKGPLGFFFLSSQLGEVFYLKGEKAAMQWLFPLLPGPRKAAPADLLGERAEERNSLGRKVKLVQPPSGSKGTHPWMHCFQ